MKKETAEKKVMVLSVHDERGFEIPDPVPIALPVDFQRPPTIQELVKRLVTYEVSRVAQNEGEESFEEADDFEVGDEAELYSPYELDDEQTRASIKEFVEEQPQGKPDPQRSAGIPDGQEPPDKPQKPVTGKKKAKKKVEPEPEDSDTEDDS